MIVADLMTKEGLEWIINSILENAICAVQETGDPSDSFYRGRMLAYYEILDSIKNRIEIREGNPADYGLDFDLDDLESVIRSRIGECGT